MSRSIEQFRRRAAACALTLILFGVEVVAGPNTWTTNGPGLFHVASIAIAPSDSSTIYVGLHGHSATGGFLSTDGGAHWSGLTLPPTTAFLNTQADALFAVSPADESHVFAGTPGGLFRSTDAGASWKRVLSAPILALAFEPNASHTLWAGSFGGLQKSDDEGTTWTSIPQLLNLTFTVIQFDSSVPGRVYTDNGQLFQSNDDGTSWIEIDSGLPSGAIDHSLAIDPIDSATLYFGRSDGLYETTDGGAHWSGPASGTVGVEVFAIEVDPSDSTQVYAATREHGLLASSDSGSSFAPLAGLCSSTVEALWIDPSDPTHLVAGGGGGVFQSPDSGADWTADGAPSGFGDVVAVGIDASTVGHIYAATNGGGVWDSGDDGSTWNALCDPSRNTNVPAFSVSASSPETLYAGTDNGVLESTNGGANWSEAGLSGDSIGVIAVDPADPTVVYAGVASGPDAGLLLRSPDSGKDWTPIGDGLPSESIQAITVDPTASSIVYVAARGQFSNAGVYKSMDSGSTFQPISISDFFAITDIVVDPANPSTLYAQGANDSYRSTDGGATDQGLESGGGNTIVLDPGDPSTIYVGAFDHVAKTNDGGTTWHRWGAATGFASSLSNLALDPSSPGRLVASFQDGGVATFDQTAPQVTTVTPSSGNTVGGDLLTIHGSFFMEESEVIFDGSPLAAISVTDTEIVVVSPPHPAGLVDVEVVNPTFLSATLSSGFEYVCGEPFTAIVQGSGSTCLGNQAEIRAFLSGVPPWTIHWSDGETDGTSDSVLTRDVSPSTTTTYTIDSVTDSSGCSAGTPSGSATITVIDPPPAPVITVPSTVPADAADVPASVPLHVGNEDFWTVGNANVTSGSNTHAITFTPLSPGSTVSLQVIEWDLSGTNCFTAPGTRLVQVDFLDVPEGTPFHDYIDAIAEHGVTLGCGNGNYCPNFVLGRDQMAALIARAIVGVPPISGEVQGHDYACVPNGVSYFTDVDPGGMFCSAIHYLASQAITLGCGENSFCPSGPVTREQMALFIGRAIAPSAMPPSAYSDGTTGRSYDCSVGSPFTDIASGTPTCNAVGYIWARGVVDGFGDGTYHPNDLLTRAPTAKFIANAFGLTLDP